MSYYVALCRKTIYIYCTFVRHLMLMHVYILTVSFLLQYSIESMRSVDQTQQVHVVGKLFDNKMSLNSVK